MDKNTIFERIEMLQEQQRKANLYNNHRLEIDCILLIVEFYNMLCRVDPENKEKYLRTYEEQSKIAKEMMEKYNYRGQSTRIEEINNEIVKRSMIEINLAKKDLK